MAHTDYYHHTVEIFERLYPSYWWTDPTTPADGWFQLVLAGLLGVLFVLAVVVWLLAPRLAPDNRLHQRLIVRAAKWALALAVFGLFLLLFRWSLVPFLSKRLWLYLWIVSIFAAIGYADWYRRRIYPEQLAAWEDSERRRRYLPRPGQGGARSRRRSRRRR